MEKGWIRLLRKFIRNYGEDSEKEYILEVYTKYPMVKIVKKGYILEVYTKYPMVKIVKKGYILEVYTKYPTELHGLHCEMLFLPDKMKINKFEKRAFNIFDKKNYVILIKALKQVLNHGLM